MVPAKGGHTPEILLLVPSLRKELDPYFDAFLRWTEGDLEDWNRMRHRNESSDRIVSLMEENNYLWGLAKNRLSKWISQNVGSEIRGHKTILKKIERDVVRDTTGLEASLDEIQRMADFHTPFGKFPIALNELILFFPLLLLAGYCNVRSKQGKLNRLVTAIVGATSRLSPNSHSIISETLTLLGSTQKESGQMQIRHALGMAIPLLVILASVALFVIESEVFKELSSTGRLAVSSQLYLLLNIVAVIGALVGLFELVRQILQRPSIQTKQDKIQARGQISP